MYVTRRLLRSTLPPEPVEEKEEKQKEVPFLPPPTPKRRAAVRASAKICEVVADASGPAARGRAAKTSPKQTENGGDEKNKSSSHKKMKKEEKKQQQHQQKGEDEVPAVDVSKLHGYQLMVDVHYRGEEYAEARILDLDPDKEMLFVHYMGWNARFDAWVPLEEVAAHGSHSGVAKKKDVSWDGDIALFATEEEAAAQRQSNKAKPKATKTKKRPALSPKARQAARKALRSVNTDQKRHSEEMTESEDTEPSAKYVVKKSPKNAKFAKKTVTKSPRAGKKVSSKKDSSSPAGRAPRRVQVAVGTTDEDSERKNDTETADLVLEVEVEGCEASNDEAEEEIGEEDEEEESKKPKRGGAINKPAAAAKTAPLPPHSGHGGLGSATREKLAAIFRLRVQQRQQMEQLNASQAGFQQSLQEQVSTTVTDTPDNPADTAENEGTNIAVVNAELAAAEEYQRQLQQYYYHQQVMLANSLSMSVAGGEDLSAIPLQGGIMDPRIIQERLTALEERRRQQAHVQAYYQQLMLTRERNVRALAANQAFMAASAAVWEQQLKETQSEDGTSSVTSWKDAAERTASAETSPTKSVSDKSDPADAPAENVLYEFVL
ncbi:hypothetical protein PHYSODRAFT_502235 [Phytophthora sojae]|uniref:Tudor-knot domain-containing protein n=1 Tax=Phytophthora sojae (strain P6497) TaxID=1094619 RepID=G4ZIC5_PHYSP|nr:hypothetical protein PHYSODRAFT_502235 [Phytophthora sojae]EGZ18761.1 hypothetical protein PHYSODRAFT_502235 [Phytophthora sojae]|eukprot:XP_009527819.1 hypothetical protein PHYSODRAFT_502235 [Phytophthora sojae]